EDFDDVTMDAGLIAGGQRAEHYEIAAYGTLIAWAKTLGHGDVAELLAETLEEEKAADEKLTSLAESALNESAADGGDRRRMARAQPSPRGGTASRKRS